MTNEIETILKKFEEIYSVMLYNEKRDIEDIKSFFSSHLTELLQSLIVDLEGEKMGVANTENEEGWMVQDKDSKSISLKVGFNEGLNLAQEKLRKLIK